MNADKKVMHFGAGNIGRGFFGELYFESGWQIVFVDVSSGLVNILNDKKRYPLWIVGKRTEKKEISNFQAIELKDADRIIQKSLEVALISISVGANNIKGLVPLLTKIIEKRFKDKPDVFLNIIIGENLKNGAEILSGGIKENIKKDLRQTIDEKVGFVETVLSRMVPVLLEKEREENPLLVKSEEYNTLPVSKNSFKGDLPDVKGFLFVDNIKPYQDMKTYIHNFSHSSLAFIGYKKKYQFIWECVSDKEIKEIVNEAVYEVIEAIQRCYTLSVEELHGYYEDLLTRFSNKSLGDTIGRVAREPMRKLGKNERIIGAAHFCLKHGVVPQNICRAASYALNYFNPEDAESVTLHKYIHDKGIDWVLENVCGLDSTDAVFAMIKKPFGNLRI